jgi:hypothetical protein
MRESTQLKEEMKRDLMRVYNEESQNYSGYLQTVVYAMTVNHPAPRFYVDPRRAHQRISPLLRGDRSELEKMKPLRREMYEALFGVVMTLSQKEKFWGKSLYYILRHAVMEPAPRFYINPARMGQIWAEQTKKERMRRKEMEKSRRKMSNE